MAEIDTRPLESVQATVIRFSPDSNTQQQEEEIVSLTTELATCKLQLEAKETEHKNAMLRIEALQKAMQELSERHDAACLDAGGRIAHLEAESAAAASRQAAAAAECRALREELAGVRAQLADARASIAYALGEVEAMEARAIMERESTREALARILQLNETVLSSAVAAVKVEEERSVFFQEVTLELFNSDKNLEVIRRQVAAMDAMERELLAKTVEIEYLTSELKQLKELYAPSPREVLVSEATENSADRQVQVCDTTADHRQEPEGEFTFQHAPGECFVSEIFRNDCQVPCGQTKMEGKMCEDVVVEGEGTEAGVQDTTELEGDTDAQETRCLVDEISGEDHHAVQQEGEDNEAEDDHEVEADGDGDGQVDDHRQGHEDPKVDASFVLESSRDDFQSVRSDDKDIGVAMPVSVAGDQEPRAEATAPATTTKNGDPDIDLVAKEIAVSKVDDEFYTKELEPKQGHAGKPDGDVLVANGADAGAAAAAAAKDKQLDAARTEISDLRFSLEEAVRRAELAEEAKAALERELREEIRKKRRPPAPRPSSDSEDAIRPARELPTTTTTARPRPAPTPTPTPAATSGRAQRALTRARPGGEDLPTPGCGLTLGKVLNMKYK
ncbi:hypothetical protein ACP4OV_015647 [Aristida adscensionis]